MLGDYRQCGRVLTHLGVAVLASTACTDEGLEVGLHCAADDGVQTLVWGLIAAEEIENM